MYTTKNELDEILNFINNSKFGLTLSIHSRVTRFYENVSKKNESRKCIC